MTDTYRGPAVVVMHGVDHAAEVDSELHVERDPYRITKKSWNGRLESNPSIDWFSSPAAEVATLRMPDGREGRFFAAAGTLGSGRVEICGTGPAPFGEA